MSRELKLGWRSLFASHNVFVRALYAVVFAYLLLVVLSFILSVHFVNEGASITIRKALYSSNCTKTANFKKANPLNVIDFYMNIEYWLAESRVPSYYLEDKACTAIILDSVRGAGTPVSVVFVDKDGNVTAVFKRY